MATVTGFPDDSAFERIQRQVRQIQQIMTPTLRAMQDLEERMRPLQEVGRRLQASGAMEAAVARLQQQETWASRLTEIMQDASRMASIAQAASQLTERLRIPQMEDLAERLRMPDFQSVVAQLDVSALDEVTHQLRVNESVATAMQNAARVMALNHPPINVPISDWRDAIEMSAHEFLQGAEDGVDTTTQPERSTAPDQSNPYVPHAVTAFVTWFNFLCIIWLMATWGKDTVKPRVDGTRPSQSLSEIQPTPVPQFRELRRDAPVREVPTGSGKELGRLAAGDLVFALDGGTRWCAVMTSTFQEGWVYQGHLKEPE